MPVNVCQHLDWLQAQCVRHVVPAQAGQSVVWHQVGNGAPLVLLHGGHGCWLHWARLIPALSCDFTLWLPDMPGYGESTLTPTKGLHELVEQLGQSLDHLLGTQAPLLLGGFSFGGLVAAELAARRPAIQRLVLVGPAGHGGPRRQNSMPLPWRNLDPERAPAAWAQRMRHNLLAQMLYSDAAVDGLAMEIHWRGCLQARFHSKPYSRSAALAAALRAYAGRTLEIWGEHDVTAHPHVMQAAHGQNRQGDAHARVVLPGAGHWLMHEAPERLAPLMSAWLKDHTGAAWHTR